METSITYLKEQFQLKDPDIRSYSQEIWSEPSEQKIQ